MAKTAEEILKDALQLPEDQRAELACDLFDSLKPRPGERGEADWIAEINSRARAAIGGEPGLEWEAVRADIEQHLPRE